MSQNDLQELIYQLAKLHHSAFHVLDDSEQSSDDEVTIDIGYDYFRLIEALDSIEKLVPDFIDDHHAVYAASKQKTSLFQLGNFQLSSGLQSNFKIECDALTDQDWECIGTLLANRVGRYKSVEGVPTGGLKLAKVMERFTSNSGRVLIVDDVLTTGDSMETLRNGRDCIGAVAFARGFLPIWVDALWVHGE